MTGLWRSSRARQAWRTATGETSRAAISRAISAAGRSASSVPTPYALRPLAPVSLKRHHARERRLAPLELPREAPDDEPLVLELGGVDLTAQVLDVDAVLREQGVMRQLVRRVREHPVHRLLAAEFLLSLGTDPVALAVRPFAEEAADREVHGMVGGNAVHAPDVDLLLEQPWHQVGMGARVIVVITLLVRRRTEVGVAVPPEIGRASCRERV